MIVLVNDRGDRIWDRVSLCTCGRIFLLNVSVCTCG